MGLYFEDFELGQVFITPARTITETDIVMFAGMSGDYNPIHTDEEFGKTTPFNKCIAHGVLGLSIVTGLNFRLGIFEGTIIAILGITWNFTAPIFAGDTVHVEVTIVEKRDTSKPDRGIIIRQLKLINQAGKVTQEGQFTTMFKRKPML